MVASGVADRIVFLPPRFCKTQAAELDPADAEHIRDLCSPRVGPALSWSTEPGGRIFDRMDLFCGWFVEGLAVYVSGQLERSHRTAARDALKAGKVPIWLRAGRLVPAAIVTARLVRWSSSWINAMAERIVKKRLAVVRNRGGITETAQNDRGRVP